MAALLTIAAAAGDASASDKIAVAALCACRGSCKRKACARVSNQLCYSKRKGEDAPAQVQICPEQPLPGYGFCRACKCEHDGCDRGRAKGHVPSGRWCFGHGKTMLLGRGQYANAYGLHTYGRGWDEPLRLTARLAFLFADMPPQDLTAVQDVCVALRRDRRPLKGDLVVMLLAGALKWPLAIDALWSEVRQWQREREPTAADIMGAAIRAIEACDSMSLATMHAEISVTGRAAATSGPAWLGRRLCLLTDADASSEHAASSQLAASRQRTASSKHRASSKRTASSRSAAGSQRAAANQSSIRQVRLGKRGRAYNVTPHTGLAYCQHLVDTAMGLELQWPASSDARVACDFARAIVDFVCEGLQIPKNEDDPKYSAVGIARKMILSATADVPHAFDECSMHEIMGWTADEGGNLKCLEGLGGREVRELFGMPPAMVACWACYLAAGCSQDALKSCGGRRTSS